jgi:membrane peptidoglycan carboxypeptidase
MVRAELESRHFSPAQIYGGGLRVRTTLSPKAQAAAEEAVKSVLAKPDDPEAALVAIEPGTGRILAVYGGRDYSTRPFNNATQALRQPGSSFKPYVLAAALSNGISLKSTFDGSSPQTFPGYPDPVRNFDNEQFGIIDLVAATANSVNTVYVPLGQKAGLASVVQAARAAGIPGTSPGTGLQTAVALGENPSLALGTSEVHPLDQAAGFATFAAQGQQALPFLVDSVADSHGHQLYGSSVRVHQALDRAVVADVTFALQSVITNGTGNPEAVLAGGRPAAGKTGTTTSSKDAWFVGYTPAISASVWLGYDPKTLIDKSVLTGVEGVSNVTGGTLPARIWKRFMDAALTGTPNQGFPPPAFVGTQVGVTTTTSSTTTSSTPTSSATVSATTTTVASGNVVPTTVALPATTLPTPAGIATPPASVGTTRTTPPP